MDWFLEVVEQMWQQEAEPFPVESSHPEKTDSSQTLRCQPVFRQVVDSLSGEDIAYNIPIRKLIKAVGFKVGSKRGFRWLYRYRGLGKKILGG
jgi:hypothetical protein